MNPAIQPSRGQIVDRRHYLPIRVYYEDTDFGGIVYHANYLKFAERGRTEFLRCLGIDQTAMKAQTGAVFAARRLTIAFNAPAAMDDCLVVTTWVEEISGARLVLAQQINRINAVATELPSDGHGSDKNISTILATLAVTLACIDDRGRAVRLPAAIRGAFNEQHQAETENRVT
jgi:acyl-CoA thioester hydrolase